MASLSFTNLQFDQLDQTHPRGFFRFPPRQSWLSVVSLRFRQYPPAKPTGRLPDHLTSGIKKGSV